MAEQPSNHSKSNKQPASIDIQDEHREFNESLQGQFESVFCDLVCGLSDSAESVLSAPLPKLNRLGRDWMGLKQQVSLMVEQASRLDGFMVAMTRAVEAQN